MRDPFLDLELNCRAHLNILETCRRHNPSVKIVYAGTRGQYGKVSSIPVDEKALLQSIDINGIHKTTGEMYHLLYGKAYGIRAVSLRLTNTYGPRHCIRMDEIQAAILSVKLKHLPEWNERRNALANLYDELLQCKELLLPPKSASIKSNHHLYVIRTQRRDDLKLFLQQRGIQSLVHYPTPVHLQPAYRDLDYRVGSFPQAEACAKEVLSIPLHPSLTISEAKYIAKSIREFDSR